MNRKKRIESILLKKMSNWDVNVEDISIFHKGHNNFNGSQESHFSLVLKSKNINNISKLKIHREINKLLFEEFNAGLHALEIKIIN